MQLVNIPMKYTHEISPYIPIDVFLSHHIPLSIASKNRSVQSRWFLLEELPLSHHLWWKTCHIWPFPAPQWPHCRESSLKRQCLAVWNFFREMKTLYAIHGVWNRLLTTMHIQVPSYSVNEGTMFNFSMMIWICVQMCWNHVEVHQNPRGESSFQNPSMFRCHDCLTGTQNSGVIAQSLKRQSWIRMSLFWGVLRSKVLTHTHWSWICLKGGCRC